MPIVSTKGLTPKQSALTERELKHLLRRTTFGLSREHLAHYQNRTLNSIVDELLTYTPEFEQPLNYIPNYSKYRPDDKYGETWINNQRTLEADFVRTYSFWSNMFQKHIEAKNITEKMTMFIHHFIPLGRTDSILTEELYWNYRLYRDNCLGNFKNIIINLVTDNAMLAYLNGRDNKVTAPDENYARELMELFTLGKNYYPIYSENDIKQAAKVLTGYQQDNTIGSKKGKFTPNRHDISDKMFSSFFGNKLIKGRSGQDGQIEHTELINMIFEKEEVSIYFATRLYRFFVYYEIDDTVKNNIILPLAKIMRDNNYEIKPVIEALIKSEHFYDTNVIGSHIKNPLDLMFGAAKEFSFVYSYSNLHDRYVAYMHYYDQLVYLNMSPYHAPDVAGWKAYYQSPGMYENWITTNTIQRREEYLKQYFIDFSIGAIDVIKITKKYTNPSNLNAFIDEVLDWHLTIEPTADIKAHMKSILLYGQIEDHYWTDLWNAYIANPWDNKVKKQLESILKEFYEFLVSLPEYQLM